MHFSPGNIVRSRAGRDKGTMYCVLSVVQNRVLVADGYKRTISNPKPKNPLHLELVNAEETQVKTDAEIRQILAGMTESPQREDKGGN